MKTNLKIDKFKNTKNIGERDLDLIGDDIKLLRDNLDMLDSKHSNMISKLRELRLDHEARITKTEGWVDEIGVKLSKVSGETKAHHIQFRAFLSTFNGLQDEIYDKDLKASVAQVLLRLIELEKKEHNRFWSKIKRFFKVRQ